jgi:hypothetical protein
MKREILPVLNAKDEYLMENILAAGRIKHKFAVRLLTGLNRAKGKGTNEIAAILEIHPMTVSLYVKRYNAGGIQSLVADKTRKPGKAPISEAMCDSGWPPVSQSGGGCLECQRPFHPERDA